MDEAIYYWFLQLIKWGQRLVDVLWDLLFAFTFLGGTREEREKARFYENSAQVVDVKWKAHYMDMGPSDPSNFLYVHKEYVHPERYILSRKHVTLFFLTNKHAVFCESDPDVDVSDLSRFPFLFISQYYQCRRLVFVPHASFYRLGEEIGDPKAKVGVINMTSRCGSTLLSQLIAKVPHSRSFSEPWVVTSLNSLYNTRTIDYEELKALCRATFRLLCKVEPGQEVRTFVLKLTPTSSPLFSVISEVFPSFVLFFNTRAPKPSFTSMLKLKQKFGSTSLYIITGTFWHYYVDRMAMPYTKKYRELYARISRYIPSQSLIEITAQMYTGPFAEYWEHRSSYKHVFLYENLCESPKKEVETMFDLLDIPKEHIPKAMEALEKDSQQQIFGARGVAKGLEVTDDMVPEIDRLFVKMQVPLSINMTKDKFKALFSHVTKPFF